MTDRFYALTVVLEQDIRDDDAEHLIGAIKMLRGVLNVKPHVADYQAYSMKERARQEIVDQFFAILYPQENC